MIGIRTEVAAAAVVLTEICNRRLDLGVPQEVTEILLLLAIYFLGDRLRRLGATSAAKVDSQG